VPERSPGTEPDRLLPFAAAVLSIPGIAGPGGPVRRGDDGDLAVPLLLRPGGSRDRVATFAAIDRAAQALGLDGARVAGPAVQIARDSDALLWSLVGCTGATLLLLFACLCAGLRSLRLGLLGMVPNVLPCLWLYGGLAWAGQPVGVATAMIGCTMLGLVVDNTLHLLHRYRLARVRTSSVAALAEAFVHCGRAVRLSSAVLAVGFAAAGTSGLATTVEFAWLATAVILAAAAGVHVVLPLLVAGPARASGTSFAREVLRAG
jgi:predicted RND superfamily exporter protein